MWLSLVLCCLLLTAIGGGTEAEKPKVVVIEVFYDSLNSYARNFFHSQLRPVTLVLWQHLQITLNPYAETKMQGFNGSYTFECPHGEKECQLNMEHACILSYVRDMRLQVETIDCMLGVADLEKCMYGALPSPTLIDVQECSFGNEGSLLLAEHGLAAEDYGVSYSPFILINGEHSAQLEGQASQDLMDLLCINYFPTIDECKGHRKPQD